MSVDVMEDYKLGDLHVSQDKTRLTNEKFASVKGECEI
jgi:hypothetical protein